VNGAPAKIEIVKPFEEAFELMKKILFQPFDIGKWLVIGFASFLAGHFGGGGFNVPINAFQPNKQVRNVSPSFDFEQWKPWLPIILVVGGLLFFAFVLVLSWIRSRGNFVFTDCIVRNRAAIAEPWREYRREGNSYFLFSLAVMLGVIIVFGLVALCIVFPLGMLGQGNSNHPMLPLFIVLFILLGLAWIGFAIFFALTTYFMVPVMYVRRCSALDAFREVAGTIFDHGGSFVLFCLFGICLLMGAGITSAIATCFTCCLAALPYIGTVILLPVFICLRSYGLFFIRQFGPDFDVWSTLPPPEPPPIPQSPPPVQS
jgi:hypothetical protein